MLIAIGRHFMLAFATLALVGISTLFWPMDERIPARRLTEAGARLCYAHDETVLIGVILEGEKIRDDQVLDVARVTSLQRLSLADSRVTRSGIQALRSLDQLTNLNLSRTRYTIDAIDAICALSNLKELKLDGCDWIEDQHLAKLASLRQLEVIGLAETSISMAGLKQLRALPKLKFLNLDGCSQITDEWIKPLIRLCDQRGIHLSLSWTEITPDGLAELRQALPAGSVEMRPESMIGLRGVGERGFFTINERGDVWAFRRRLDMDGMVTLLQPGDLSVVGRIPNLRELNLEQTNVDDQMLDELPPMPGLETLRLSATSVTDDGLSILSRFPNLTSLWMIDLEIEGRGLARLRDVPRLVTLKLQVNQGDEVLSYLKHLTELRSLAITAPLSNGAMNHLSQFPNLRFLALTGTSIGAEGIADLMQSSVSELRFEEGSLSDDDIDSLARLTSVKWLVLFQTAVTRKGRDRLQNLRPDLVVHWTGNQ